MSCSMAVSSSPVAKSWPWNWKRRATSGSNLPRKRTRWASMASDVLQGLSRDAVVELSRQKGEPEWMLQKRLYAWEVYEQTPAYLGRRGDLGTFRTMAKFVSRHTELRPYVPA